MIEPIVALRVLVAATPVDFRKGLQGLAGLVREQMAAVPEPATWAMAIIAFGAVGSMVRTSRRQNDFKPA
ncbi:MAG: PEPxxWA-CTERM sorting domain-containing protein [Phenylobacterium sp.]|nr:PEPxxWA-CTERM sorting domain-containing protein [Phenylobacterium sp.]MDP1598214.1 PEPxxWA-CTERM sorting domain-containing protein [Phenylobacterium sp.]MDP3594722.1 PEPxxWA-CTERM sorting domain-containing protein [Phenylobacterium sp.]